MADGGSLGLALTQVHLACGRIAGGARAIADAHRFGSGEGPHESPWTAEYHREAVHVYGETLPESYQRNIASLFSHSVDAMAQQQIPAGLAQNWVIVASYMRNACEAIMSWLGSRPVQPLSGVADSPEIDDHTPAVIRFDRLAALCTREGACRLERAALAVQHYVGAPSGLALEDEQRRLLNAVASGTAIADVAADLGYSRRSIYRELSKLWEALGVTDRAQAIRKAFDEGLLD